MNIVIKAAASAIYCENRVARGLTPGEYYQIIRNPYGAYMVQSLRAGSEPVETVNVIDDHAALLAERNKLTQSEREYEKRIAELEADMKEILKSHEWEQDRAMEYEAKCKRLEAERDQLAASADAWKVLAEKFDAALKSGAAYRCFHCGNVFTGEMEAQNHFGSRDNASPTACLKLELEKVKQIAADNKTQVIAYGNLAIGNPKITREIVAEQYDNALKTEKVNGDCPSCGRPLYAEITPQDRVWGFAELVCPDPDCGEEFIVDLPSKLHPTTPDEHDQTPEI